MKFNAEWISSLRTSGRILLDFLFLWLGARIEASRNRRGLSKGSTGFTPAEPASRVDEIAPRPVPDGVREYPVVPQSMNLTRRTRALNMRHRGDEPHTIAAALGVSRGEVELLFKLDRILQQPQ